MANRLFSVFAPFLAAIQENENARLKGLVVDGAEVPYGTGPELEVEADPSKVTMRAYDRGLGAYIAIIFDAAFHWLQVEGVTRLAVVATGIQVTGSTKLGSYTVATLPSASTHGAGATIYVSDETGGGVPAFSDGTNWRRVTDRNIVA